MADDNPGLASSIYPHLVSDAEPAPAPAPAATDKPEPVSMAEAIYGSGEQSDADRKRDEGVASGIARPAAEIDAEAAETAAAAPAHLVEAFNSLAKEVGLSDERSAALRQLHERAMAETSTRWWDDQGAAWEKQSRAQFGARLDGMVGPVKTLINDPSLTTPGFKALLGQYKLGNHPDVVRTLANWAAKMRR